MLEANQGVSAAQQQDTAQAEAANGAALCLLVMLTSKYVPRSWVRLQLAQWVRVFANLQTFLWPQAVLSPS